MKLRKIAAGILAAAMLASVSTTALAATDPNVTNTDPVNVEITGTTNVPSIKVTIPTTGSVVVNPYKLSYAPSEEDDPVTSQIVFAPVAIKSETASALDVSATVTGKPTEGVTLATATTQGSKAVTTKSVFMYMEVAAATADENDEMTATWAESYDKANTAQLLVGTNATSSKGSMYTIPAAADESTPSYAAFKLDGDVADKSAEAWTSADKVDVTIAFTFTPVTTVATEPTE